MSSKIYKKRGPINYKERKLINQLEPALEKLAGEDPEFFNKFKAAESFDELQQLHGQYCITDAQVISDTSDNDSQDSDKTTEGAGEKTTAGSDMDDPMNRANPKVRDYVLNDQLDSGKKKPVVGGLPEIAEPTSHEEAFRLPDEDLDPKERKEREKEKQSKAGNTNPGSGPAPKQAGNSVNPAFDELTNARKKKQTKRFAKYIVEIVCTGLEHGYVWWVTKDISEAKLAEYELDGKILPEHMDFMISLSDSQEVTVRDFFALQCSAARENAPVSKEDREELADALADVLEEKGLAPTPMQNLIVVGLGIVAAKALPALAQKSQSTLILESLFRMTKKEKEVNGDIVDFAATQKNRQRNEASAEASKQETAQQPVGAETEGEPVIVNEMTVYEQDLTKDEDK